jgi:dTDP-4-amino-4,6-dideoxygalactose transaminase
MWPWFHPGVPWTAFPAEAELKRSVFILPVHQSLHRGEIDRIIAALRNWSRA